MPPETKAEHNLRMKFLISKYGDVEHIPPMLFHADLSGYSDYYYMIHPDCEQLKTPAIVGAPGVIAIILAIYMLVQIITFIIQ